MMRAQDQQSLPELEKSKASNSLKKQPLPGLWLAVGVAIGNLLFVSMLSGDIAKGALMGAAAGFLVMLIYRVVPGGKANE